MKIVKHIMTIIQVAFWRNLAKVGIGDPLNQLVIVAKYRPYRDNK